MTHVTTCNGTFQLESSHDRERPHRLHQRSAHHCGHRGQQLSQPNTSAINWHGVLGAALVNGAVPREPNGLGCRGNTELKADTLACPIGRKYTDWRHRLKRAGVVTRSAVYPRRKVLCNGRKAKQLGQSGSFRFMQCYAFTDPAGAK